MASQQWLDVAELSFFISRDTFGGAFTNVANGAVEVSGSHALPGAV
jgi:hypothetical protein